MDMDETYALILDRMDQASTSVDVCDWTRCRALVMEAITILDHAGQGDTPAARNLSGALAAIDVDGWAGDIFAPDRMDDFREHWNFADRGGQAPAAGAAAA